jgi:palmitoyltransferase
MVDATAALLSGRTLRSLILTRYDPATSPVPLHGDVGPTGRYCEPCGRWQGVRVKHCRACGRCVARFDHHCGWLGTCVGRHNQRLFFGFLSMEMVVTWYAFGVTVYETVKVANRPHGDVGGVAVLATFLGLSGCMLMGMWGGHIYLIMTNQTTFEQLKDRSPGPELWYLHGMPLTALPFSHGTWNNIVDFFTLNPRLDDRQDRQDVMQQQYAKDETWWDNRHYNCC